MPENVLNYSQITQWQRCKYAWYLTYERKVRRRFEGVPISIGSAVHLGLAAELRQDGKESPEAAISKWYDELIARNLTEEEEQTTESVADLAVKITKRALKTLDVPHRFKTIIDDGEPLVEKTFSVPLSGWGIWNSFKGTVDWVPIEVDTGRVWLVDHKVRKSFLPEEYESYNTQMALYAKLLSEKTKIVVHGSMMHQLKSAVPRAPKVNKNGTISKALILTDWETYCNTCVENGQNPCHYEDMRQKLSEVEWYRLTSTYWPENFREHVWKNAHITAREIGYACGVPRSIMWMNCAMCRLKTLCMAELHDDDTEFLMKTEYQYEDEQHEPLPTDFDDEDT